MRYFPPLGCAAGGFDPGSQVAVPGAITFGCEKLYESQIKAEDTGETSDKLDVEDARQAQQDVTQPFPTRGPSDAYPNPLRGVAEVQASTATTDEPKKHGVVGARNVADAVNMGYKLVGAGKANASDTYTDESSTLQELTSNYTTTTRTGTTEIQESGASADETLRCQWKMAGCSSYTFKPRETRGSILAINVILQADAGAF